MRTLKRKLNLQIRGKRRNIYLFLIVSTAVLALLQIQVSYKQTKELAHVDEDTDTRDVTSQSTGEELERVKLILVYTPWDEPWVPYPRNAAGYKLTDWDGTPCEESRCQITYDKNLINVSAAVLVHGVARKPTIEEMTRNRPSHQRWVFYVKESPVTWDCVKENWDGLFNWTATYRRDSDFFVPYGSYAPLTDQDHPVPASTEFNYAKGKDKLAVFVTSRDCHRPRSTFVRALMKHIQVDVYGKCAPMFDKSKTGHCPHNLKDGCLEELQRHKFYLAFENSMCKDYITEKYWRNSLERGLVPVVLGGASYDAELVIPGSFINAADFGSFKALADYLKYLDKNDEAYNQYFQWKSQYKIVKDQFWLCRLCKALHDPTKPVKIYHKLSEFWSAKKTCTSYPNFS